MNWEDLVGTWTFCMDDPEEIGFLTIYPDGRAFQSTCMKWPRPGTRVPMMLHMHLESPGRCRTRLVKGHPDGWIIDVSLQKDQLILGREAKDFLCTRVEGEEIPEWFLEDRERAMASWPP